MDNPGELLRLAVERRGFPARRKAFWMACCAAPKPGGVGVVLIGCVKPWQCRKTLAVVSCRMVDGAVRRCAVDDMER